MTAKLKSDALRVIKKLRCYGTDAEDTVMWTVPVTSTTLKRMLPM